MPWPVASLLTSRHHKFPALVERLILIKDVGSHGRAPTRLGIRRPPRITGLTGCPERHADDLLLVVGPVRVGSQHALRTRTPGPFEFGQLARLDPECRHPDEVLLHCSLLRSGAGSRRRR